MSVTLNSQQKQAVNYVGGPLLVIAGAGTGKTTVITERIKKLILSGKVKPSEVLALTFTEKAAREMEDRVDVGLPYGYTQMWLSTFHGFCDQVLRAEALHIGLDPTFKLATTAESIQFLRNNLFNLKLTYFAPLGNPTKFVGALLAHFSRLQDEDVLPETYVDWAKHQKKSAKLAEDKEETARWTELARAYQLYTKLKIKNSLMDYGDLITHTLKLFRHRKSILKNYQTQFKHILVDEYQDTNIAQNELVKLLAAKGNITVVADDDQSVYKWRGAAVSNVIQFRKSFPKAKVITLTLNYRSSQEILDKSYDLIQFNNPDRLEVVEKIDKKLVANSGEQGEAIGVIHADRVENEAQEVASKIAAMVESGECDFADCAILVRANSHAEPFVRALGRAGIPHQFLGPGKLFSQPEVVELIAYLKILTDPHDSVAFYQFLRMAALKISEPDLVTLINFAKKRGLSTYEVLQEPDALKLVNSKTHTKLTAILTQVKTQLKATRGRTAGELLYQFLADQDLLSELFNPDTALAQRRAANIARFFDKLKTYEVDHEDASVAAVVDWIELASDAGESPLVADSDWTQVNAVNLLTVHSAKGLEFPVVFLVNLVAQRFPTIERRETLPIPEKLIKEILPQGDYHIQEERRLFYVGMTRAKSKLFFTAADYYGEGKREKRLSPFIFEALDTDATAAEMVSTSNQLAFSGFEVLTEPDTGLPTPHIDYLSYSQIQTFDICPLHYKLRYIVKIPTPQTAAQSFGTSLHETMREFYSEVGSGAKPTAGLMKKLLTQNWIADGYRSKTYATKMFERGVTYLTGYLQTEFSPNTKVLLTEQPFVVPLTSRKGERRLKIGGKIDRVDNLGSGQIEIVDYKTSERVPTQKDVDKDLQLTFYALAATKIAEQPFARKCEQVKLSLYYFDQQVKLTTMRTAKQLAIAQDEIYTWRKRIEESDFICSKSFLCSDCEFSSLCKTGE